MSTLFAKNGFSRPSLEQLCCVFRHVLCPLESPPSVPINEGSALHDVESFKRQRTRQLEYARLLREERPRCDPAERTRGGSLAARGKRVYSSCGEEDLLSLYPFRTHNYSQKYGKNF